MITKHLCVLSENWCVREIGTHTVVLASPLPKQQNNDDMKSINCREFSQKSSDNLLKSSSLRIIQTVVFTLARFD